MSILHHKVLPGHSTLLSGRVPIDECGFRSDQLQIWYNNTSESWIGPGEVPHMHVHSDECFIVLAGSIEVEVNDERHLINAGEFCCFPAGVYHSIVSVGLPIKSLMVRAPSVEDKVSIE
jgi:mannose-6-phosphate isomerase-like protein (cupin superfamily)